MIISSGTAVLTPEGTEFTELSVVFPNLPGWNGSLDRVVVSNGRVVIDGLEVALQNPELKLAGDAGSTLLSIEDPTITLSLTFEQVGGGLTDWALIGDGNSITLSASAAEIFPVGGDGGGVEEDLSAFTARLSELSGMIDVSTGRVTGEANTLHADFGESVELDAEDIAVDFDPLNANPAAPVITVGVATLAIGQLRNDEDEPLRATVQGFEVRRNGFSIENGVAIVPGFIIDGALATDAINLEVQNIVYNASADTFGGTIRIAATNFTLFPGSDVLTSGASEVTATIVLGGAGGGGFSLEATDLFLQLSTALRIDADLVAFNPGNNILANITFATVTSPDFADLPAVTINDLQITRDGFILDSLTMNALMQALLNCLISRRLRLLRKMFASKMELSAQARLLLRLEWLNFFPVHR